MEAQEAPADSAGPEQAVAAEVRADRPELEEQADYLLPGQPAPEAVVRAAEPEVPDPELTPVRTVMHREAAVAEEVAAVPVQGVAVHEAKLR